jgi:hypothetical protein
MSFHARTYVALVHHPVMDKEKKIVTTAVTNLDIHDIARASRTFGLAGYFVVTPIEAQRALVGRIIGHWAGPGREQNDKRTDALSLVSIVSSIDEAISKIPGERPFVVATGARPRPNTVGFDALKRSRDADPRPVLLLFGTGWGLAEEVFARVDATLERIKGPTDYNHLSVRSAVAIVLDRLFSVQD